MPVRFALLVMLALAAALPPTTAWDKPPEQWSKVDTLRVLQDSPWSPAKVKLDAKLTYRRPSIQVSEPVRPSCER